MGIVANAVTLDNRMWSNVRGKLYDDSFEIFPEFHAGTRLGDWIRLDLDTKYGNTPTIPSNFIILSECLMSILGDIHWMKPLNMKYIIPLASLCVINSTIQKRRIHGKPYNNQSDVSSNPIIKKI